MMQGFEPKVPKTDEEVKQMFDESYTGKIGKGIAASLWGLYSVARAQGEPVLEAYRKTLETHIKIHYMVHGEEEATS
jgi:hypothetical protein